ncbi:ribosomal protein S18-alanine N-acetyltransferase [Hoyosella rhizosphaerae]|uniref:Ribosomal-protein-alanine acetyltransferase n=1 Tax=Hoyosella rhizosphaerae TaxID=1755582 RepID=A0A916U9U1_9ACTN|nr:ribosomal protein S18-alanine N-acetyltransferase [Hoyosella rhizosphaerae]MBN4926160.1 ribosomal protein S18-alanine N-acetyltransferase [Hoyosella rhizosphaerae]GGC65054.1 ribosomal-protein-alanine acetyltransferase [Hoyosella rhizosphaerae]
MVSEFQESVVQLRPLVAADANACARLERLLFSRDNPWPAWAFVQELKNGANHYVAAELQGKLVGYAGIALLGSASDPENEVHTIGVAPEHQGKGIGRLLLDDLLAVADVHGGPVFLDVRTDNEAAQGLYSSVGFVIVGLRKRYYEPSGADAFVMKREGAAS